MAGSADIDGMIGPHKSALMMRAIGTDRARRLMSKMSAEEIDKLSRAMDDLGVVAADTLEDFFDEFMDLVDERPGAGRATAAPTGSHDVKVSESAPSGRPNLTDFTT